MALSITPISMFGTAQLAAGNTTLFVTPAANTGAVATKLVVSNTTASAVNVTLWKVNSGGAAATTTQLVPLLSIPAYSDAIINEVNGLVLPPGASLVASPGSAAALNVTLSGYVYNS